MKKLIFSFLAIVAFACAWAQKTETRSLSSFSNVSVHQGITAILSEGTSESARVEASGVDLNEILTEVSGGSLKIKMDGNNYRNIDVTVYVTYKRLSGLHASSAGSIEVKDKIIVSGDLDVSASSAGSVRLEAQADEVDLDVSSSGDIDIIIQAKSIEAQLSSSGDISISGTCDEVAVDASSAGDFDGYSLVAKSADLEASSGSSIKIEVTETLDARASSGASIRYKGSPKYTNSDSSSGGSVRKGS